MTKWKVFNTASGLLELLWTSLSPLGKNAVQTLCARASQRGVHLYLVGGSVRDLLLETIPNDLDIVVEGSVEGLAFDASNDLEARLVLHPQFGTATINAGNERYDLATARREIYQRSGVLPKVTPCGLEEDLIRRDFTINSMAVSLNGNQSDRLIDPVGGFSDLRDSIVRVLHPESFLDDPTRMFRAVRYEQRLCFHMEEGTLALMHNGVADEVFKRVGPYRIRRELNLMLNEARPYASLARAAELGILQCIFPDLGRGAAFKNVDVLGGSDPLAYLALLAYPFSEAEGEGFIESLKMPTQWARIVRDTIKVRILEAQIGKWDCKPSQVVQALLGRTTTAIRIVMQLSDSHLVNERLTLYLTKWRFVKSALTGRQLVVLGVPPGDMLGRILNKLRCARLDGEVTGRDEEEAMVKFYMKNKGQDLAHGR